ncbi:MAG: dynamin family protein [Candidatus Cloacimonadaceae bacterium]|nr:dynamin family protein [Candidatus Cloacimonadaceae bacterium]
MLLNPENTQIDTVIKRLAELGSIVGRSEAVETLHKLNSNYQKGIFRIVVIGEIKKGKSSFINALLGQPSLVPVQDDIATSTVYKLVYGKEHKIRVYFKDIENKIQNRIIKEAEIAEYGTEDGNPQNKKGVEFIAIQSPNPLLKKGIVIIDTPGLGGIIKQHKEITWKYIPNADAIFFVCDSVETLLSRAEIEYLQKLKTLSPYIFFVQTKTDIVPQTQWEAWMTRNKDILAKELNVPKEKLIYFPVSSKLKHKADRIKSGKELDRSGFSKILYFLYNHLIPQKSDKLYQNLLISTISHAIEIHRLLTEKMIITSAENKEQLDTIEKQILEERSKYENWRNTEYPSLVKEFQDNLDTLKRTTRDSLFRDLDPSPNGTLVSSFVKEIREMDVDSDGLNTAAQEIISVFIDKCHEMINSVLEYHNKQEYELCSDLSQKLLNSEFVADQIRFNPIDVRPKDTLGIPTSTFEKARTALYGGMAGGMLASIVAGIIFPPSLIVTIIGGALGGAAATLDAQKRKREEYLRTLESILCDTARRMQSESIRCFENTFIQYDKRIRDMLGLAIKQRDNEFKNKLSEIQAARQQTQEQRKENTSTLQEMIKSVKKVIDDLNISIQEIKQ